MNFKKLKPDALAAARKFHKKIRSAKKAAPTASRAAVRRTATARVSRLTRHKI